MNSYTNIVKQVTVGGYILVFLTLVVIIWSQARYLDSATILGKLQILYQNILDSATLKDYILYGGIFLIMIFLPYIIPRLAV